MLGGIQRVSPCLFRSLSLPACSSSLPPRLSTKATSSHRWFVLDNNNSLCSSSCVERPGRQGWESQNNRLGRGVPRNGTELRFPRCALLPPAVTGPWPETIRTPATTPRRSEYLCSPAAPRSPSAPGGHPTPRRHPSLVPLLPQAPLDRSRLLLLLLETHPRGQAGGGTWTV